MKKLKQLKGIKLLSKKTQKSIKGSNSKAMPCFVNGVNGRHTLPDGTHCGGGGARCCHGSCLSFGQYLSECAFDPKGEL